MRSKIRKNVPSRDLECPCKFTQGCALAIIYVVLSTTFYQFQDKNVKVWNDLESNGSLNNYS
jgi:hypothetical protein